MRQTIHHVSPAVLFLASVAMLSPADTIFRDGFELCRVPGVIEWDGGGDGLSWNDPLNWVGDTLPTDGDAVAILMPASLTVEYAGLITTLSCLGATSNLSVNSGQLILDGPATVTADVVISGGTLTANGWMSVLGALHQNAGLLEGAGTAIVHGSLQWSGGAQRGTGTTEARGGANFSGANSKRLSERTLSLGGASSWTGSGPLDLRWGATINVDGALDIATDADLLYLQGDIPTINVNGSLTKSSGNGETDIGAKYTNNGAVTVNSGQLTLGYFQSLVPGSSSGVFHVATGSILRLNGSQTFEAASSITGAGGLIHGGGDAVMLGSFDLTGPLDVALGTLQFSLTPSIIGNVTLSGGNLEFPSGATLNGNVAIDDGILQADGPVTVAGAFQQSEGSVQGTDVVTVGGLFTWTGGRQWGVGETILNGGTAISGADTKRIADRTLTFNTATEWTGTGPLDLRWGAVINVNAPFSIATDADMVYLQGNIPSLNITDSFTKSAGAGETIISAATVNDGSIEVSSGQLRFTENFDQGDSGSLTVNIAGAGDFDAFPVAKAATLDGTLNINLLDGYEPPLSETFEILTAVSVNGVFDPVNGTAITAGRKFDVTYAASSVSLVVVPE